MATAPDRWPRVLLLAALFPGCAAHLITARTFRVQRVIDGDALAITYDGGLTSVCLAAIDAPERPVPLVRP